MFTESDPIVNEVRESRRRKIQPLIDILLLASLSLSILLVNYSRIDIFQQHKLGFFCDDRSIRYKYLPDTVPVLLTMLLTMGFPFCLIVLMEFVTHWSARKQVESPWYRLAAVSSAKIYFMYSAGFMAQELIADCLRVSYGKLRPHFIDVCRPDFSRINGSQGYIEEFQCTSGVHPDVIVKARQSFPSGHAILAFYTVVFSVYYIHRRLTTEYSLLLKLVINVALCSAAVYVSITRITDNAHHVTDVIAGAAIGIASGMGTVLYLLRLIGWDIPAPAVESKALKNIALGRCYGTGSRDGGMKELYESATFA